MLIIIWVLVRSMLPVLVVVSLLSIRPITVWPAAVCKKNIKKLGHDWLPKLRFAV